MANYVSVDDVKTVLSIDDTNDDAVITATLDAVERMIEDHTGRFFYQDGSGASPVERLYVAEQSDLVWTDDIVSVDTVTIDDDDDDVVDTDLASADYRLEPLNADKKDRPYTRLAIKLDADDTFNTSRLVRVKGVFGWPSIPETVKRAVVMQTERIVKVQKEAPFGVAPVPGFEGTGIRMMNRLDPNVETMLAPYVKLGVGAV